MDLVGYQLSVALVHFEQSPEPPLLPPDCLFGLFAVGDVAGKDAEAPDAAVCVRDRIARGVKDRSCVLFFETKQLVATSDSIHDCPFGFDQLGREEVKGTRAHEVILGFPSSRGRGFVEGQHRPFGIQQQRSIRGGIQQRADRFLTLAQRVLHLPAIGDVAGKDGDAFHRSPCVGD